MARESQITCALEALKGDLDKSVGDEILSKYKLWFENQSSYQFGLSPKAINQKWRASIRHSQVKTTIFVLTADGLLWIRLLKADSDSV